MANDLLVDPNVSGDTDVTKLVQDLTDSVSEVPKQKQELGVPADALGTPNRTGADRPGYIEEKYWTGNVEESLAKQHEGFKNLQSRMGQMANDLGAQRRLTDEIIGLKREQDLGVQGTPQEPEPLPKLTATQLLEQPDAALDDYMTKREARLTQTYEQRIAQLESQLTGIELKSKHGDYDDLINDPSWSEFLNSTPLRQRQAQYAASGDTVVADALLAEFKASRQAAAPSGESGRSTSAQTGGDDLDGAAAVALESAAAGQTGSGKIYSRVALMKLRAEQPDVYEDPRFQDEILKAYDEKRVR